MTGVIQKNILRFQITAKEVMDEQRSTICVKIYSPVDNIKLVEML